MYPSYSRFKERGGRVKEFYFKRYIRIAPSIYFYIVMILIILLAIGAISFEALKSSSLGIWLISNFVLIPVYNPEVLNHIGVDVINGSLWTISVLVMFYIAIPLVYYIEEKYGFKNMITGLIIFSVLNTIFYWWLQSFEVQFFAHVFKITLFPHLIFFSFGILWSKY
ncbi:acyltransferase family protein [Priestia endophytica]|uniref:acyltransferase family protein n=1 Tax=Priestia endophytica TaxID=135735 RepID=UPI001F5B6B02|nr:acyltransferase family protein [Priestia endophytica]